MKKILFLSVTVLFFLLSSCNSTEESNDICVVATIFPQYDMASSVAGEYAKVEMLLPLGSESHGYEPTFDDMKKVSECDIFIYTGDTMESWATQAATQAAAQGAIIVDLSKSAVNINGEGHNIDPHIWLDPQNAIAMTNAVADALCEAAPENADTFLERAMDYTDALEKLDERLWELSQKENTNTLCFGGKFAFGYVMDKYGFDYVSAYDDCSHGAEPDANDIAKVIKKINENGIKTVYHEELSDAKVARTICDETGAELYLLHSCHNISKEEFEAGVTFIDLMSANVDNIEKGLSD